MKADKCGKIIMWVKSEISRVLHSILIAWWIQWFCFKKWVVLLRKILFQFFAVVSLLLFWEEKSSLSLCSSRLYRIYSNGGKIFLSLILVRFWENFDSPFYSTECLLNYGALRSVRQKNSKCFIPFSHKQRRRQREVRNTLIRNYEETKEKKLHIGDGDWVFEATRMAQFVEDRDREKHIIARVSSFQAAAEEI